MFSDAGGFKFSGCPTPQKQEVSSGTSMYSFGQAEFFEQEQDRQDHEWQDLQEKSILRILPFTILRILFRI